MNGFLRTGVIETIYFVESLIKLSDGTRLVTGATVRVCIDGTWGAGAGTLAVDETDQWKYTLHADEAAALDTLVVAIDHADAVGPIGRDFRMMAPASFALTYQGAKFNERGGRIWYLAASGGSDSNAGTFSAPLETPAAAISAASEGDTIFFKPGTYAMSTTAIDVSKKGLTLCAAPGSVTITSSVVVVGTIDLEDGTTLDGLNITNTAGLAFVGQNVSDITIKRCTCSGWQDACAITNFNGGNGVCHFEDSRFISQQDVVVLYGMRSARINRCSLFTDGTVSIGGAQSVRGINAAGSTVAQGGASGVLSVEDCEIDVVVPATGHPLTSGTMLAGIFSESNSIVTSSNCLIRVRNLDSGLAATVDGVLAANNSSEGLPSPLVALRGARIVTSNANGAGVNDLRGRATGSGEAGRVVAAASCRMDGGAKIGSNAIWDRETIDDTKTRILLALPAVEPAASGGLPTGNASNQVLALDGSGNAIAPAAALPANFAALAISGSGHISRVTLTDTTTTNTDMRGTDGANTTAPDNASIAAILIDTADMQPKLGTPAVDLAADIAGVSGSYISDSGTAQAGSAGTLTLQAGAVATDDYYNYQILTLTGGTGAGQARIISDYVGSTKVATVNGNWATTPDGTTTYTVTAFGQIPGATAPTAIEVRQEIDSNSTQLAAVLTKTRKYTQLALRKDAGIAIDNAPELTEINADEGSGAGTFSNVTDSDEARRDNVGTEGSGLTAVASGGFTTDERLQLLAANSIGAEIGVPKQLTWTVQRRDGKIGSPFPIVIDPTETQDVACDFRSVLATGDAITSITSVELVADADVGDDVDSPAFADVGEAELWLSTAVRFALTGGTSGNTDQLKVTVLTVDGHTLVANVKVRPSSL
jgi:hypothetical protein